jgi:polyisoprenoid-binding protein YceI
MKSVPRTLLYALVFMLGAISLAYGDGSGSAIRFVASQSGVSLTGNFNDFAANVKFDPAHPETGTVKVGVNAGSVSTGTASADELLRSEDFFDATKFPQATFEASEFHVQDAKHYVAKGTFTLKGRAVPQTIVFTSKNDPQGQWFDGSFTISRLAFGVGQGEWSDTSTLDDPVQIQFHILQKRSSP